MKLFMAASLGGALGAGVRYLVVIALLRMAGPSFPWGTLTVNALGSLAMGLCLGLFQHRNDLIPPEMRLFLTVGMLGGFTTFSAFSLDLVRLLQREDFGTAALYMSASIILSVAALAIGLALAPVGLT